MIAASPIAEGVPATAAPSDALHLLRQGAPLLADLTLLTRFGFSGPGAAAWLLAQGLTPPADLFGCEQADGLAIIRPGTQEYWVEAMDSGERVPGLRAKFHAAPPAGAALLFREEVGILLAGTNLHPLLLQTCGFDYAGGKPTGVVFTRVAGVSCMSLYRETATLQTLRLWFSPSYAIYLWTTLRQIAQEAQGQSVSLETLLAATREFSQA